MKGSRACDNTYSISEEIYFFFISERIILSFHTHFISMYDNKYYNSNSVLEYY